MLICLFVLLFLFLSQLNKALFELILAILSRGRKEKKKYHTYIHTYIDTLVAQRVKNLPAMQETHVQPLGQENPLEKRMATHSSILAWRIPRTQESGRLQGVAKSQT